MSPAISEALIEAYLETVEFIHISTLPRDQKTCPVCQDPYLSQPLLERPVRINSLRPNSTCRHVFGRYCIEMHIRVEEPWSVRCPICREDWFTVHDGNAMATVAPTSPVVPRQVAIRPLPRPTTPRPAAPRPVDSDVDDDGSDEGSDDEGSDDEELYFEEFDGGDFDDHNDVDEDHDEEGRRWRVSRRVRLVRYLGFMDRILGQLDSVGRANPDDELARLLADLVAELERR